MNTEITCFYKLLSYALHPDHSDMITQTQKEQIRQKLPDLLQLARQHNVSLFVYDALCQCDIDDPLLQETTFQREMLFECYHNYDMLFFAKKILALLEEHSVSYCLLKGVSLLANYPKPESVIRKNIRVPEIFFYLMAFAWQMVRQITMKNFFIMKTTRPIC